MRMKTPPQPLVFRLEGATALCGAVAEIYRRWPAAPSCLCIWQGFYYLRVGARLCQRGRLARAAGRYGICLGPCPVLFAYCREHGEEISADAVAKLGKALTRGQKNSAEQQNGKNCK